MGVFARGGCRTLTELSRLAGVALLGASACASSREAIQLRPASVPVTVQDYEARGETVVEDAISRQRLRVTREQHPELTISPRLEEHELGERFECASMALSSRLGDARVDATGLTIDECHLGVDEIENASLSFDPNEAVDIEDLPNRIGLQIGGSAFFQISYRRRLGGPLFLDLGAYGQPHAANASTGLVVQMPISERWATYLGVGGGFGITGGEIDEPGCDPETTDCPRVRAFTRVAFVYFRVGLALALGRDGRDIVGLDVGVWEGQIHEEEGPGTARTRRLLWPMAGLSYHYAF